MNKGSADESVESRTAEPTLCSAGCGFFSNVGTGDMCSKCFREAQSASQAAQKTADAVNTTLSLSRPAQPTVQVVPAQPQPTLPDTTTSTVEPSTSTPNDDPSPPPSNPCRCNVQTCRKKLGLTGFKCRCGHSYCGQHRYAESHQCEFDYRAHAKALIADSNPLVQASKIQKF